MEDKEVKVGSNIVLECMASGSPKPKLHWTKDGSFLQITDRHFFSAEDQLLIIMNTVLSDSGIYQCELVNSLGINKGESHLTVFPCTYFFVYSSHELFFSSNNIAIQVQKYLVTTHL